MPSAHARLHQTCALTRCDRPTRSGLFLRNVTPPNEAWREMFTGNSVNRNLHPTSALDLRTLCNLPLCTFATLHNGLVAAIAAVLVRRVAARPAAGIAACLT